VPELIIIAGPNGAGKTTFANEYLKERSDFVFVNADEIRRELAEPPFGEAQRDVYAGRLMIEQINALVAARRNFTCETTLASLAMRKRFGFGGSLGTA
jgi:predicted ABC-type ATPase